MNEQPVSIRPGDDPVDWPQTLSRLDRVLRIRTTPIGMKMFEPSLSIPCYAERRYGGVNDDEMLMALSPGQLVTAIDGMEALAKNGLRYPIPPYGIQTDARAGLGASY